jgi:putative flippase GtrA
MSEGDAISSSRVGADEDQVVTSRFSVVETEVYEPRFSADPSSSTSNQHATDRVGSVSVREARSKRRAHILRLARYAATSGMAFALSEATLLILYGNHLVGATTAALIANVVATVPSYLMSRYWIWKDAERTRVGRQVVLYWATSAASILLTSLATGAIAHHIPTGHSYHLAIVGFAFLVVNVVFWLLKFVVYHKFIFPTDRNGAVRTAGAPS